MITGRKEQTHHRGQTCTFARHETFHLRDGWLLKGLAAIQADEFALYARDAHHNLGLGLNMLKSLLYWLQATNLVQAIPAKGTSRSPLRLTRLAELVCAHDPYFEDLGTLWLLHVELAANRPVATFWYWAFNEFAQRECTEDQLGQGVQRNTAKVTLSTLFTRIKQYWHLYSSVGFVGLCIARSSSAPETCNHSQGEFSAMAS